MTLTVQLKFQDEDKQLVAWLKKQDDLMIRNILKAVWNVSGNPDSHEDVLMNKVLELVKILGPDDRLIELEHMKERERMKPQQDILQSERDQLAIQLQLAKECHTSQMQSACAELREQYQLSLAEKQNSIMQLEANLEHLLLKKDVEHSEQQHATMHQTLDTINSQLTSSQKALEAHLSNAIKLELASGGDSAVIGQVVEVRRQLDTLVASVLTPLQKVEKYVDRFDSSQSSTKGRAMEDKYFVMLQQALPKSELRLTRDTAHTMDIMVISDKQAPVLIDIKCYTRNVGCDEIQKFHDDMLTNASHGILVSAETGVACKNHMQVDCLEGKLVAVYLRCVKDDVDQIVAALNVVHSVDGFMRQHEGGLRLDQETLDRLSQRVSCLSRTIVSLKECNEQQRRLLQELELDTIVQMLSGSVIHKNTGRPDSNATVLDTPVQKPRAKKAKKVADSDTSLTL